MITFVIFSGTGRAKNETFVRVTTGNGQPWFNSEGYSNASNARRSVRRFCKAAGIKKFEIVDET